MKYPYHPLADRYPLLDGDDFSRFVADVKARGLDKPIALWNGRVIDGRNRLRACEAAGVEPAFVDRSDIPEPQLEDWIATQNEHRRHLTTEFLAARRKERIVAVVEMKNAGDSNRTIAAAVGVSEARVRQDLAAAAAQGCAVGPEDGKVRGRDGRKQPAARKAAPAAEPVQRPLFDDAGGDVRPVAEKPRPPSPAEAARAETLARRLRLLAQQLRRLDTAEKRRNWLINEARVMHGLKERLKYKAMLGGIREVVDGLLMELDT